MALNFSDPKESVALGQADTGRAFILPNTIHDPLEAGLRLAREEQSAKDKLAAQKAAEEKARKESELGAFLDPTYGLDVDVDFIRKEYDKYNMWLADQLSRSKTGLAGDPLDPRTKEGRESQLMRNRLLALSHTTGDHQKQQQALMNDVNANPEKYDPSYREAIARWRSTPLVDESGSFRASIPSPDAFFNEQAYDQKTWEAVKEANVLKGGPTDRGGYYTQTSITSFDPDDVLTAVKMGLTDPRKMEKVVARYGALDEGTKRQMEVGATAENKRRNQKGLPPITAQEYFSFKEGFEDRMNEKRETTFQQKTAAGIGRDESLLRGKFPVQQAAGIVTGTSESYKPLGVVDPITGIPNVKTGYLVSDVYRGYKLGENGLFAIDQVIYDPSTKTTSYTIKPTVDKKKLPEAWRKNWEAYEKAVYTPEGNLKPSAALALPKLNSDEFYGSVMVQIAQGNKSEFKEQDWLNYLEDQKIPYEAGNVPLQRLLDDQFVVGQVKPLTPTTPKAGQKGQWGQRADGTQKGNGYFGPLKMQDGSGKTATEISIGIELDGKEIQIPTLVPTLTEQEKQWLLKGNNPTDRSKIGEQIVQKATKHAQDRMSKGQSPFAEDNPQKPSTTFNPLGNLSGK